MNAFEVVARENPDKPNEYHIKAGVGCLALSVGWMIAVILTAVALIMRVVS
jgi:hypothetical protein